MEPNMLNQIAEDKLIDLYCLPCIKLEDTGLYPVHGRGTLNMNDAVLTSLNNYWQTALEQGL